MSYISIKNTEHKGVYKEKEFNKELLKTKGISYRKFKSGELDNALNWAGVKNIKKYNENTKDSDINVPKKQSVNNPALEIILDYKNKGFNGVCLTTRNFGEIYLMIDDVHILMAQTLEINKEKTLSESLSESFEKAKNNTFGSYLKKYPYNVPFEILKFKNLSEINVINSKYLNIRKFGARRKSDNSLAKKKILLSEMNERYTDCTINIDDILLIQGFNFEASSFCDNYCKYINTFYVHKRLEITLSQVKELEKLFIEKETENLKITTINEL